jgi:O-antigen ligase
MRSVTRALLLGLAFVIPWEYSLDLGEPYGNIARVVGVAVLLVTVLAVVRAGHLRAPGTLQWLTLGLFLWLCCSALWALDRTESLRHLRTYAQELMILWVLWEFVDTPLELRRLIEAYVAGAAVLAALTLGSFVFASNPDQVRFVAQGHDPNDAARMLVFALPLAALLVNGENGLLRRTLFGAYLPFGTLAVLLTASRSGFLALLVALAGCFLLLLRTVRRAALAASFGIPALAAAVWLSLPRLTLLRVVSVWDELQRGSLNQRWNIWEAGWQAFVHAPYFGSGAGSFVIAARLAPTDTAHNTALALVVEGGIVALVIAFALVVGASLCVLRTDGPLRIALASVLAVGLLSSMVATVQENRATWLLLGLVSVAARLAAGEELATPRVFASQEEGCLLNATPAAQGDA